MPKKCFNCISSYAGNLYENLGMYCEILWGELSKNRNNCDFIGTSKSAQKKQFEITNIFQNLKLPKFFLVLKIFVDFFFNWAFI